MIKISGICKKFGSFTALESVNINIPDNTIWGLIGYNGAGKTTLLNIISGLYKPSAGGVLINIGEKSFDPFDCVPVKHDLFYVTDDPYFESSSTLNSLRDFYRGFWLFFKKYSNLHNFFNFI